jgi:hypothetical protein
MKFIVLILFCFSFAIEASTFTKKCTEKHKDDFKKAEEDGINRMKNVQNDLRIHVNKEVDPLIKKELLGADKVITCMLSKLGSIKYHCNSSSIFCKGHLIGLTEARACAVGGFVPGFGKDVYFCHTDYDTIEELSSVIIHEVSHLCKTYDSGTEKPAFKAAQTYQNWANHGFCVMTVKTMELPKWLSSKPRLYYACRDENTENKILKAIPVSEDCSSLATTDPSFKKIYDLKEKVLKAIPVIDLEESIPKAIPVVETNE